MILVDYREGSKDLLDPLRKVGLPAEEGDVPADLVWEGRGERGAPVLIGVEFKKLPELVQSIRTERLQGHQLLKMRREFAFSYLLVEGEVTYDHSGQLTKRVGRHEFRPMPGAMSVCELYKRLFVFHLRGGLNLLPFTRNRADTLKTIESLYRVWTDKDLDQHESHIAIYQPPVLKELSEFRQFMTRFDGLGLKTSADVEKHFGGNLRRAVNASKAEWMKIPGVGKGLAQHIQDVLDGRSNGR